MIAGRVYRCYDADGELIYVGHTMLSINDRMSCHRYSSPWFYEVETVHVDEYPTWEQARQAERLLIDGLRPRHNKLGNPDWRIVRGAYLFRRSDVEALTEAAVA